MMPSGSEGGRPGGRPEEGEGEGEEVEKAAAAEEEEEEKEEEEEEEEEADRYRYPSLLTVSMLGARRPSFLRRPRTTTSTTLLPPWYVSCQTSSSSAVRETARPSRSIRYCRTRNSSGVSGVRWSSTTSSRAARSRCTGSATDSS